MRIKGSTPGSTPRWVYKLAAVSVLVAAGTLAAYLITDATWLLVPTVVATLVCFACLSLL